MMALYRWMLLIVFPVLVFCKIMLLPDPISLRVYPGKNITLQCLANSYEGDALRWFIGDSFLIYAAKSFPINNEILPVVLLPSEMYRNIPGLVVMLNILASFHGKYYFESNLTVIPSKFKHSELLTFKCGTYAEHSNPVSLNYTFKDLLPHPSSISCSLFSSENPGVTFQWNSSFNSQHAVERYHVAVTPDITDCSRYVNSSENYNCSRLTLGTNYTFSVSVVNSENDKGMKYSITIQPQVPQTIPKVKVQSFYDHSLLLSEVKVQWRKQVISISERCSYDRTISYILVLESNAGNIIDQKIINSDNCDGDFCSTSIFPSLPSFTSVQMYHVSVSATNVFGVSRKTSSTSFHQEISTITTDFWSSSKYSLRFDFDNCMITLLCSNPSIKGECFIQYGKDPLYQDLNPPIRGPINFRFTLPLLDEKTIYYYKVNNNGFQFMGNFTTGKFAARLSPSNQGIMAMGSLVQSLTTVISIILIVGAKIRKGPILFWILLIAGRFLVIQAIILWVVVGFQVNLQKNTCENFWRTTKDILITVAFFSSTLSLLCTLTTGVLLITSLSGD